MDLVDLVYDLTAKFPREELFGLTGQMRRSAVSVPSNTAEGFGRDSTKEYLHHLAIAYGSLMELETQSLVAQRRSYITAAEAGKLLDLAAECGRLNNGLKNSLKLRLKTGN